MLFSVSCSPLPGQICCYRCSLIKLSLTARGLFHFFVSWCGTHATAYARSTAQTCTVITQITVHAALCTSLQCT